MKGQRYVWNGKTWVPVEEVVAAQAGGHSCGSGWPLVSKALKVHPKQVAAARARAKRHGIAVEYANNGDCILPDPGNRRKLLRLEGFRDNQSFC